MKKRVFILVLFLTGYTTQAQFHFGAKAGANLTRLDGQSFNDNYKLGYQLGGFVYYDITDFIGVQAEVLFNQTNTEISDRFEDIIDRAFDKDKTLNYISVPVLLRLNSGGLLTINAGPQFSFLASKDQSVLENGERLFKDSDFAAVLGAEVNLFPIIIYGRYTWGFSDISQIGKDTKSQQIQLGVALRFF
ncbi:porin family protein [Sinomicrobium sp. M5D2P17]